MAEKEENKRISLTLSKELDEKIDRLAGLQNISRNAVIENLIVTSIDMQIGIWETMKNKDKMQQLLDLATALRVATPEDKEMIDKAVNIMKGETEEDRKVIEKLEKEYEAMK